MKNIKISDKTRKILESFGYSKNETKKIIFKGSTLYEQSEFIRFFSDYMKEWGCDIEEISDYRKMIETGECPEDWDIVEFDGKIYYLNIVS